MKEMDAWIVGEERGQGEMKTEPASSNPPREPKDSEKYFSPDSKANLFP